MNYVIQYEKTDNLLQDVCGIIESAQHFAYQIVDSTLVIRNWCIGKRIAEETLKGEDRAQYGAEVVANLSKELTSLYGKGYTLRSIYKYLSFYRQFPDIVPTVGAESDKGEIVPTAGAQLLSWSHYRALLSVEDKDARN